MIPIDMAKMTNIFIVLNNAKFEFIVPNSPTYDEMILDQDVEMAFLKVELSLN